VARLHLDRLSDHIIRADEMTCEPWHAAGKNRCRLGTRLVAVALVALSVASCASDEPSVEAPPAGDVAPTTLIAGAPTASPSAGSTSGSTAATPGDPPADSGADSGAEPTTAAPVGTAAGVTDDTSTRITLPDDSGLDPVPGGTFRFALIADVDGLNPTSSALTVSSGIIMANAVFDTLAAIDASGNAVPYLGQSFTPSEDFSSWTVQLRPGIEFHDGAPLDAAAVQLNFESQRANGLVGLAVRPFYPDAGASEVLDDLTIRFNLLEPNRYWPQTMATQLGMMASPVWLEAALLDPTLNQRPVGTGPFVFDTRSEDSVTRFVRNDNWWKGTAYLEALEFLPVTDSATRADLLLAGEIDGLQSTEPASILQLREDPDVKLMLDDAGAETLIQLNTSVAPFDDIRARQALAWATPRDDYLSLIGLGTARAANGRFAPESPYADPSVVQVTDDPRRATELAAEYCTDFPANCADGKMNMEYQWPGPDVVNTRIADLMIESWSVAFNVTRDELFQDEHVQQTALGAFNTTLWQAFAAVDPVNDTVWLSCSTVGPISLNFPRYCDSALDATLLAAAIAQEPSERADLYQASERILNESFARIYLSHALNADAFSNNVHGVCNRTSPEGVTLLCSTNSVIWHDSIWIG
jgi:peptide/nickel transport system substrate-binding protein